jgi:predicted dehydrogenase
MISTPLRTGVIGSGSWTRICHIPCLQADPRAQVVALCGRRPEAVRAQADEFNIPQVYTDYRDLIASSEIDSVTIATPNIDHYPIARLAITAGKHVFCEKPLTMNQEESFHLWQLAESHQRIHQVSFTFRHLYSSGLAKQLIADGVIGEIYRIAGYAEGASGLRPDKPYNWRDSVELAGSGMLGDMGSHLVDLARYVTGLEFSAVAGNLYTLDQSASGHLYQVTSDDEAEFFARFTSGATGYFRITRIVRGEPRAYLEVTGTKGALRVHYSRGHVDALYHAPAHTNQFTPVPLGDNVTPERNHALYKMLSAFVGECVGEQQSAAVATFADGHRTQEILDAVIQSAQSSQTFVPIRGATL